MRVHAALEVTPALAKAPDDAVDVFAADELVMSSCPLVVLCLGAICWGFVT